MGQHSKHLRGQGPLLPFEALWNDTRDYLGLIVGFHDKAGQTVYGKVTRCREGNDDTIHVVVEDKHNTQTRHVIERTTPTRVLTQRRCPWCCEMFHPSHQDQRYCEPDHEAAYDAKCRATRKLLQSTCHGIGITCLDPDKKRYLSEAEAVTGAKNSRRHYGTMLSPYLCVCERWHLGHPSKTPKWLGCGNLEPNRERIAHYLSAHDIDTTSPKFANAATAALDAYRAQGHPAGGDGHDAAADWIAAHKDSV